MRDTQTEKPQVFRTGDGWFACNSATKPSPDVSEHPGATGEHLRRRFLTTAMTG